MQLCRTFDRFDIGKQSYIRVGEQPHERRDGRYTILVTWQSTCQQCGHQYTFDRPQRPAPIWPPRRCRDCTALEADPTTGKRGRGRVKVNTSITRLAFETPNHAGVGEAYEMEREEPSGNPQVLPAPELLPPVQPVYTQPASVYTGPVHTTPQPAGTKRKGVFTDR